jgi:hypothetical protein
VGPIPAPQQAAPLNRCARSKNAIDNLGAAGNPAPSADRRVPDRGPTSNVCLRVNPGSAGQKLHHQPTVRHGVAGLAPRPLEPHSVQPASAAQLLPQRRHLTRARRKALQHLGSEGLKTREDEPWPAVSCAGREKRGYVSITVKDHRAPPRRVRVVNEPEYDSIFLLRRQEWGEVELRPGVGVGDKHSPRAQQRSSRRHPALASQQHGLPGEERRGWASIAGCTGNLLGVMVQVHHHALAPGTPQLVERPGEQRPTQHLKCWLRDQGAQRLHSFPTARREEHAVHAGMIAGTCNRLGFEC